MKTAWVALFIAFGIFLLSVTQARADSFEFYWGNGGRSSSHHRHGPTFDHDMGRWHGGRWEHGRHGSRDGWWWVIGDSWYLYPRPVYPYPDIYARPVYVAPAVVVEERYVPVSPLVSTGEPLHFDDPYTSALEASPASSTYIDGMGRTCREYQSTIIVNGQSEPAYGTACLQPDGTWRVVQ